MHLAGSLVFWGFMLLSSMLLFPIAVLIWLVTLPFDRRKWVLHRFTSFWAALYTWLNPAWNITISGRERLDEQVATVFVANHLSLLDILVLFRLWTHFRWVSKAENFRVPLIGWNMRLCDYIPIRRGERRSVVEMMRDCTEALAGGNSILMFPEGTRSATGRLRSFRNGAFELALRNGAPIQPLIVRGTAEALPKQGFILRGRHAISVEILDPIPHGSFASDSAEDLANRVRSLFVEALASDGEDPDPGNSGEGRVRD